MAAQFQSKRTLPFLFLFHFFSLFFPSAAAYNLPDQYFINCGSPSTVISSGRNFSGDSNSGTFALSSGDNKAVENPSPSGTELYRTARIFTKTSHYEFNIQETGTYVVRFHFYPFPSLGNSSDVKFSVIASGFSLLSNFNLQNSSGLIEEFLITVPRGKFKIYFVPSKGGTFFAFVNAIETFIAPPDFIPDSVDNYPVSSVPLRTIHRINVGGAKITPNNDTLLRNWIPDDDFLFSKLAAKNSAFYNDKPKYNDAGSTEFDAPDFVYKTAKEMNLSDENGAVNNFNVTWTFPVIGETKHLVRVHFCDIVSRTTNEFLKFNLFLDSRIRFEIYPYGVISQNAAPFYRDFVVYSDGSGLMNLSIGPPTDISGDQTAFLNGVEIFEEISERGLEPGGGGPSRKIVPIVIGSVAVFSIVVLVILGAIVLGLKRRKFKSDEALDWPLVFLHGGTSYGTRTSVSGSPFEDLNLGLKIPLSEIRQATKGFDPKLMIGGGGFGKVYKGRLKNGTKVAVKRSESSHGQGLPEFQTEIILLSKIRHNHLVSLVGYCDERDEMILVYEFMEKGTLREHLYTQESGPTSKLSWEQRLKICIDAAKGIHYLHTGADGTIIHRDIKSTNILLDENYVAKVADFGISRSGLPDQSHTITDVKGTFGYLDPEYIQSSQMTQKLDVYAFGVVLLETLCARSALDNSLEPEKVNLAEWAMTWQRNGQLDKIVDPCLDGKIDLNSLRKFGETVEKCLKENGSDRPDMVNVLWDLEYSLKLQSTAVPREVYDDSTTDMALNLPMPVIQRLPSHSVGMGDDDMSGEGYSFVDDHSSKVFFR